LVLLRSGYRTKNRMSEIPSIVRLVLELQRSLYWLVNLLSFLVSKRRIHHIGFLVSMRSLISAGNWRVMVKFMCQSACLISPEEWTLPLEVRTQIVYRIHTLRIFSVQYKPHMHECISFLSFWSSFFYYFHFYCFLHFLVIHTGGSESKSLHSDWVASLKFSAPVLSFFRHISLILQIDQYRILSHSVRSYATYLCHLTRCRPKPCIRSVTYTLMETGYSFEIFINTKLHSVRSQKTVILTPTVMRR